MSITLLSEAYNHSVHLRKNLIAHLQEQNILHSESIASALQTTPREAFVPSFFHTDAQILSASTPWVKVDATHPDYLPQIYQDQPLVTHLDAHGIPDSSSSMPTVMVQMLEELGVERNHSVLEIGTGTGYNAALIACLAKTCTTIDREPSYIEHMQQLIQQFHLDTITASIADGIKGYPENAPYDRIIVTASTPTIPQAWIDQLNEGGCIVCDLDGPLARAFVVLNKLPGGTVRGTLLPTVLNFMPMKSESIPETQRIRPPRIAPIQEIQLTDDHTSLIQDLLDSRSFRWFLQWHRQHIKLQRLFPEGREIIRLIAPDEHSYITFSRAVTPQGTKPWQAMLHAEHEEHPSLWDNILQSYQTWTELGQPKVEQYSISIGGKRLLLLINGIVLPL